MNYYGNYTTTTTDGSKGVPECRPGAPGREGGSNAGHEIFYKGLPEWKKMT